MWETIRSTLLDFGAAALDVLFAIIKVVVVFWIATWVARWARRWIVSEFSRRAFARNSAVLMGRLASIAIQFVALLIVLRMLGANWTALLAFAGAGTVALSLSLQDVLKNFISGVYLLFERPFRVGDSIKVRDVEGTIQGIDIRTTMVKNERGELVLVPNATVFTEILTNRSRYGTRRVDVTISGARGEPEAISQRLKDAFAGVSCVRKPLEWPKVTKIEPDGTTLTWSVFVDGSCDDPSAIANALNGALPDVTIEFAVP